MALTEVRKEREAARRGAGDLRGKWEARLRELDRREEKILDGELAGHYSGPVVEKKVAEIHTEREAVEADLAALVDPVADPTEDAALAWLETMGEKVSRYGVVPMEMRGGGSKTVLGIFEEDATTTLTLEPDAASWQALARLFLKRVTIAGAFRNNTIEINAELTPAAEALSHADGVVSQLVRTVHCRAGAS